MKAARLLRIALAVGLISVAALLAADLARSPYGYEATFVTGEARDVYWDPSSTSSAPATSFVFERPDAPGLEALREEVGPALAGSASDLSRAVAIRQWVRRQVDYGTATTDQSADVLAAVDILNDGRRGVKSPCNRLAALFITACIAQGLPARMIHLSTEEGSGHFVAEVWLRDQRRWTMMDPSLSYYARIDGAPASTLEMHRAVLGGRREAIVIERDGATSLPDPSGTPFNKVHRTLDYFRSFSVVNRNDFLTHRSKHDPYTLLVWRDGAGSARPAAWERFRALSRASLGLLAAVGAAWIVTRRRP